MGVDPFSDFDYKTAVTGVRGARHRHPHGTSVPGLRLSGLGCSALAVTPLARQPEAVAFFCSAVSRSLRVKMALHTNPSMHMVAHRRSQLKSPTEPSRGSSSINPPPLGSCRRPARSLVCLSPFYTRPPPPALTRGVIREEHICVVLSCCNHVHGVMSHVHAYAHAAQLLLS